MPFSSYTHASIPNVEREFGVASEQGLFPKDVETRVHKYGQNVLGGTEITWLHILRRQFTSPFIYLLVGAAFLAYILGEAIDGTMILLFVAINTFLGFYQEYRSEQTVRLLQKYTLHRARVLREGKEMTINSTDVVPGDIVLLSPGDMVPCDIRVVVDEHLMLNESVLTGESVNVSKLSSTLRSAATQIFEATNICFSGTVVVSGEGRGIAIGTGKDTVIGGIAKLTGETEHVSTFEKGIGKFSRFILRLILVTLVFMFVANIAIKKGTADIPALVIFSIALAVSVIPEALPVVTTFSLSRGALRLAKNKVVVKRLSAIEDLGSIEILCTDKTGTLTENVMTVADFLPLRDAPLLQLATLAAQPASHDKKSVNSFDDALWRYNKQNEHGNIPASRIIHEIPFDPSIRRNIVIVDTGPRRMLISRGAPEEVVKHCQALPQEENTRILGWIAGQGMRGRRVIAVAWKDVGSEIQDAQSAENGLQFAGIVAFEDPLKSSTIDAVSTAKALGVRVKILTGDSPEVAGAVGHQIGLASSPTDVMTGDTLARLSVEKQRETVERISVFARVSPEQKYTIIQLLQKNHEIGFLGEGMNDAPALKIANVALVVNDAADIAREAADIVLLKKSLKVIVDGIQEGRQVFANTTKYIKATLTSNFGNFYAVAIASLLIDFLPMLPLQILLVNLLSDFPMIAVAADTVDREDLQTPRQYDIKEIAMQATILGIVSTVFDFIFFGLFYKISPEVLQTNWFIGSIITELFLLFSIRTKFFFIKARRPSAILVWLSASAFVVTMLLPFIPLAREIFHFSRPTLMHLGIILGVAVAYFVTTEIVKLLYVRFPHIRSSNKTA